MIERFSPKCHAPRRVAILAFDGVVLADLALPCEIFARARGSDGERAYEVRVCGLHRRVASEHLGIEVPFRLASVARADLVIVPGIDDLGRSLPDAVLHAIRRAAVRGATVASICTGAFALAESGLLDGRRATTHWRAAVELARRYPRVEVDPNVLYIDNGNVLTSAGAAAAMDLCLHLVRRDLGAAIAAEVARSSVMPLERAGGQAQFIVRDPPSTEGTPIARLLRWVDAHLERDLTLEVLAKHAGMSPRTLCRRFRDEVGAPPAAWIAHARVARAQHLLETSTLSVERIAEEVGLTSATVLRQHFARLLGTSPRAYRQSFALAKSERARPARVQARSGSHEIG